MTKPILALLALGLVAHVIRVLRARAVEVADDYMEMVPMTWWGFDGANGKDWTAEVRYPTAPVPNPNAFTIHRARIGAFDCN